MRKSLQDSESVCSTLGNTGTTSTRKRGFSLRRLLVASHIIGHRPSRTSSTKSTTQNKNNTNNTSTTKDVVDAKSSSSSKEVERGVIINGSQVELHQIASRFSNITIKKNPFVGTSDGIMTAGSITLLECPLCLAEVPSYALAELSACNHRSCFNCLAFYLRIEISESRVCIACPECAEPMHPNEIRSILDDPILYEKYEDFMVRRVLAVDPDTRWCPAPDCSFAVIAAGCASCPKIRCERPGCNAYFCYHCKAEWHPNQTCDAARAQRSPNMRSSSVSFSQDSQHRDDIKPCPRCQVLIVKMDDGSCNHMMCAVCGAEFCWLCMKEISDLHYLSPSGCTFWGKKPWSRKKKILWQLGTLVGAPVGIALVAGIAVPAMIIGIPVWVGRKLYTRYRLANKHKRNAAIVGGAIASVLISPVLAGLAVGIGVPILLFYVYGVVPVSLCRSGGCGVTTTGTGVKFEFDDENDLISQVGARNPDNTSIDAVSHRGANPSIGEASISMVSGSQMLRLGHEADRESASNVAIPSASLAGSIGSGSAVQRLEVQADVASTQRFSMSSETASASLSEKSVNVSLADDGTSSTRALAGSMLNCKTNGNGQGSETCSCITGGGEDCSSERVRFDDNISFIAPYPYEFESLNCTDKVSIGSSCSFRNRCAPTTKTTTNTSNNKSPNKHTASDTNSNDSISIDMSCPGAEDNTKKATTKKNMSATEMLRSMFFQTTIEGKPLPIDEQDVSKQSLPIIQEPAAVNVNVNDEMSACDDVVKIMS